MQLTNTQVTALGYPSSFVPGNTLNSRPAPPVNKVVVDGATVSEVGEAVSGIEEVGAKVLTCIEEVETRMVVPIEEIEAIALVDAGVELCNADEEIDVGFELCKTDE